MVDVLVVGAGPVGLTMAAELRRFGLSVRMVEKAEQRTDKSKALVLWSRTLELLDRAGWGESFVQAGHRVHGASIFANRHRLAHVGFDHLVTPHPYALMLPQSETERLLEEHLNALGVRVERRVELLGFSQSETGVHATLRSADGASETLDAAWMIGCDGAHSTVRHTLGLSFEGDTMPSDWVLADVMLRGLEVPPDELPMFWHADGILAMFPITAERYRVIADIGGGGGHGDPSLADIQKLLDARGPGGVVAHDPVWLSEFHINERKVADYRVGRVFLAGDAAHIHSPAGGQGMNTGMQDACNLAWKLAMVQQGLAAAEPLLSSYSIERSEVGHQVLKAAGRLTRLAILRGGLPQALRNHAAGLLFGLAPVRQAMADQMAELSIGYPHSPLTKASHHHPAPGQRAPLRLTDAPVGRALKFAVFGEHPAPFGALVDAEARPCFTEGDITLVRPDGYIALVSPRAEDIATYLSDISPPATAHREPSV